jgi:hypothetical protein
VSGDSVLFDGDFGLVVYGHYGFFYVVLGEAFEGPLQEGLVKYWKKYLWPCAA